MILQLEFDTLNDCNSMMRAAMAYARAGWPVFPCRQDKSPLTKRGFKDATLDEAQIQDWWTRWPDASIGVPTGRAIGAWVLDVDIPDGPDSLADIEAKIGTLPKTLEQCTGSGGRHLFFALAEGDVVRNSAKKIGPGLDIRGEGGYVIVPPSMHPSGKQYQWVMPHEEQEEGQNA